MEWSLFLETKAYVRRKLQNQKCDTWRNSGGKNGLKTMEVPPELSHGKKGMHLTRRRGKIQRDGLAALNFLQLGLTTTKARDTTASKERQGLQAIQLYQVLPGGDARKPNLESLQHKQGTNQTLALDGSLAHRSNVAASAAAARIAASCTWMGPAREQPEPGGGAREFGQW